MKNNILETESAAEPGLAPLKSDATRQRWEMFHRAIAHAKRSNFDALQDDESAPSECESDGPHLSVVR